jgi:archaellum biogenesis protein FlaJ (TadC family)
MNAGVPLITSIISLASITVLVCFILVLVAMYNHQQTTLMIVCIVLVFVIGIGALVAFIYGWMQAKNWRLTNLMYVYSGALLVLLVLGKQVKDLLPL